MALIADLPDSSLTADSVYLNSSSRAPPRSRLHTRTEAGVGHGGWASAENGYPYWIQVDLLDIYHVHAVATQGRDFGHVTQFVSEYSLFYGVTEELLQPVLNATGNTMLFTGNTEQYNVVTNEFDPVRTRFVRLNIMSYRSHPALRWEVYGCFAGVYM